LSSACATPATQITIGRTRSIRMARILADRTQGQVQNPSAPTASDAHSTPRQQHVAGQGDVALHGIRQTSTDAASGL
jgi:hypothetical protein